MRHSKKTIGVHYTLSLCIHPLFLQLLLLLPSIHIHRFGNTITSYIFYPHHNPCTNLFERTYVILLVRRSRASAHESKSNSFYVIRRSLPLETLKSQYIMIACPFSSQRADCFCKVPKRKSVRHT